jgi:hypothetical protein
MDVNLKFFRSIIRMDDLKAKVGTIESALQASSRLLQSLEEKAHKSISEEVTGMRDALMDSDHRIQYVSSKVQPFLATIEYGDPSSIDLSPQMNWLSTHLGFIVGKLQTAESRADSALSYAQTYRYQFKDVGQTVEMNKTELGLSQKNSEGLASEAKSQLRESELLMEQTQSKIRNKENEISRKAIRASLLRLRTQELESEIETTRSAISTAEREAERKKENGTAVGVVCKPALSPPYGTNPNRSTRAQVSSALLWCHSLVEYLWFSPELELELGCEFDGQCTKKEATT